MLFRSVLSDDGTSEVVDLANGNGRGVEDFWSSLPNALHVGAGSLAIELAPGTHSAISMRLGDGDGPDERFKVEVFDADGTTLIDIATYTTRWGVSEGGVAYGFDYANPGQAPPTLDTDGDGVSDGQDAFPLDVAASVDRDNDGKPDEIGRAHV